MSGKTTVSLVRALESTRGQGQSVTIRQGLQQTPSLVRRVPSRAAQGTHGGYNIARSPEELKQRRARAAITAAIGQSAQGL